MSATGQVVVVLDPTFGSAVLTLPDASATWVLASAANDPYYELLRQRRAGQAGCGALSSFEGAETPEASLRVALELIEDHHSEEAGCAWDTLVLHGLRPSAEVRATLGEHDASVVEAQRDRLVARRQS